MSDPTQTTDPRDTEIDRLRRQVAQLRAQLDAICPPGPHFVHHKAEWIPEPLRG